MDGMRGFYREPRPQDLSLHAAGIQNAANALHVAPARAPGIVQAGDADAVEISEEGKRADENHHDVALSGGALGGSVGGHARERGVYLRTQSSSRSREGKAS